MDEFYDAVAHLPPWLALPLARIPSQVAAQIYELRFKTGAVPMAIRAGSQNDVCQLFIQNGIEMTVPGGAALSSSLTQNQIAQILFYLCGGSVHSYEDELRQGYFTLTGGHRIGVGGKYIPTTVKQARFSDQYGWQLQQATSLNFRIARHKIIPISEPLAQLLSMRFVGIVILGEPNSGKTTVLKSFISYLQQQKRTVVVLDERNELAMPGVDVLSGMEKSCAVQVALRTLSPEVIVLDEIGTLAELDALEQGFFGGVDFIATLHAGSFEEAERKPQFQYLKSHKMLRTACLLRGRHMPGQLCAVQQYNDGT